MPNDELKAKSTSGVFGSSGDDDSFINDLTHKLIYTCGYIEHLSSPTLRWS